jgi:hypothetical protein
MEDNVFPTVLMDTTCHTSGCVNDGVTYRVNVPVNADNVFRVICGTCSQYVSDLVEVEV